MVKKAKLGKSAATKVEKPRKTVKAVSVSSKIKRAEGSSKNLSAQLQECVEKRSKKLGSTSSLAVKSLKKSPTKTSPKKSSSENKRASTKNADDLQVVMPSPRRCSTRVSTFKRTASHRDESMENMPPRKKAAGVVTKKVSPKKVNDSIQKKKSVQKKQNTRKINNNKKSNNNNNSSKKIKSKSSENNSQEITMSQNSDKMMPFIKLQDIKHLTPERQHNLSISGNIETTGGQIVEEKNAVGSEKTDNCESEAGNMGSTIQNISLEDDQSKSKSCGKNDDNSSTNKSSVQSTSITPDKKDHPLFTRKFISVSNADGNCDATASQEAGKEETAADSARIKFTVATYNILADCHAQRDYSGSNSWISKEELSMEKRHARLMDEIKWLDADVFCFQEVGTSYFSDLLKPSMAMLGYEGLYLARVSQEYQEGEATFFKISKFKLKASKNLLLGDLIMDEIGVSKDEQTKKHLKDSVDTYAVSLLVRLEELSSGLHISVANVHVAFDWFKRQDKQCLQIATTIKELQKLSGDELDAQVMCGDFNSCPDSPPQLMIRNGILSEDSISFLQKIASVEIDGEKTSLFNHVPELFDINTAPDYKSAYQTIMGLEPHTSRFDPDGTVKQVDYIYYSGSSLVAENVLSVPDKSLIQDGVPNSVFPSDHLSLMAEFSVV